MVEEDHIRKILKETIVKQGRKKSVIAEYLGYKGATQSKINALAHILNGKKILTLRLLNKLAEFLMLPVGYFIFEDISSELVQINEDFVISQIGNLFTQEYKDKKDIPKKYKLGALLGGGSDNTAKIQTVNRILQKKRQISIAELQVISSFFEKPIEYFLFPDME